MHGEAGHFFTPILILLASALAVSTLFYRLRIPALLAFLLVGMAFGPTGLGVVTDVDELRAVAELGLVFLLFVLGLEFSFPRLMAMRHTVFRLGAAQVGICTLVFFLAFYWWGLAWSTALVVSGGLALSSTAIVSRELMQLGQLHQRHGQIAIGMLLFQDLVAVGLLISVPLMAGKNDYADPLAISLAVAKSVGLLVVFFFFARYVLPRLLSEVARTRSDELLVLAALVTVLVAAMVTEYIGLSMELGAFLAGMMLGESRFKHQLEVDVRPFRDVFLGLFFISIGMLIDVHMLQTYWFRILVSGVALLVFKGVVIAVIARWLGESWRAAIPAGLALAQGGEFLFALLALATRDALVAPDVASFLLSVTIVSMVLTPVLIRKSHRITAWALGGLKQPRDSEAGPSSRAAIPPEAGKGDHVIILGFGRVGQTIARFLRQLEIPYLALETDMVRIAEAVAADEPVYYGDTTRPDILKAAGVHRAALLVVSFDDPNQSERILHLIRDLNPRLPVLARTRDDSRLDRLLAAGAREVVPETLEAGLTLVSHVLLLLDVPSREIHQVIDQARRNRYKMLHGFYHGERVGLVNRRGLATEILHAVRLGDSAWACGKTLSELRWPKDHNPVTEIHRDGKVIDREQFDEPLAQGDVVMLIGTMAEIDAAEAYLLRGRGR